MCLRRSQPPSEVGRGLGLLIVVTVRDCVGAPMMTMPTETPLTPPCCWASPRPPFPMAGLCGPPEAQQGPAPLRQKQLQGYLLDTRCALPWV